MKLYRYIGKEEYKKLVSGEILTNTTDWSIKYDTNSKGFCFFAYNRTDNYYKILENSLTDWLDGIVTHDYIIEIEIEKARKAWGYYASGKHTEYNLISYSIENVKTISKVEKMPVSEWIETPNQYLTYKAIKIYSKENNKNEP